MQKLRNFLKQTERHRSERGSSMLETVITIPLLTIFAGMLAYGVAQSFAVIYTNNLANSASNSIQKAMTEVENAQSCYELEKVLKNDDLFQIDAKKGFTITQEVSECGGTDPVTIQLQAIRTSDSHIIFETTAKNFIPGSGNEEPTP
jgi:hypothetical protein